MKVAQNTVVTMTYVLHRETADGEIIQETTKEQPFQAIFGAGMLLPKFEENLDGLEPGATFGFALTPAEGYGERKDENILDVNKEIFVQDGVFNETICQVGATVWFTDNHGQPFPGRIMEIGETTVKVDFNPELAGVPLYFTGEILDVREVNESDFGGGCGGGHCHNQSCCDSCGGGCGEE